MSCTTLLLSLHLSCMASGAPADEQWQLLKAQIGHLLLACWTYNRKQRQRLSLSRPPACCLQAPEAGVGRPEEAFAEAALRYSPVHVLTPAWDPLSQLLQAGLHSREPRSALINAV